MFYLRAPSEVEVRHFISQQRQSTFSYPEVGASAGKVPNRYNLDHNRILLGTGELVWRRAVEAIRNWQMFSMPWVRIYWPNTPLEIGADLGVSVNHFGIYSLNACRIVYLINEGGPLKRFGFAYGTLAEHAESGEERFAVEWDSAEDRVWYDILAFSRPQKTLAKLGYPLSRMLQRRFATASMAAILAAASRK